MRMRIERVEDQDIVREIHLSAFEGVGEANLVDRLRHDTLEYISLVAENSNNEIVGHIMFSPVRIEGSGDIVIMGLAPVSVKPEEQNKGYGSALIKAGLIECLKRNVDAVVLLGHAAYYPRFGFKASTQFDMTCEYDVPPECFMVLELKPASLDTVSGIVRYHPAFKEL